MRLIGQFGEVEAVYSKGKKPGITNLNIPNEPKALLMTSRPITAFDGARRCKYHQGDCCDKQ